MNFRMFAKIIENSFNLLRQTVTLKESNVNPISFPVPRAPIGELKLTPIIDKQQQALTCNLTRLPVPGRLGNHDRHDDGANRRAPPVAELGRAVVSREKRELLDGQVERASILNLDARNSTHPIQTSIDNESHAANAVDAITYGKGEAFLRMLEAYFGAEPSRKSMRADMARH